MNENWKLLIGCHDGSVMGRDIDTKVTHFRSDRPLESYDDCVECAKAWRTYWWTVGQKVWFAHAIDPDGVKHKHIINETPYR